MTAGQVYTRLPYTKSLNQLHNHEIVSPLSFHELLKSKNYVFNLVNTVDTECCICNSVYERMSPSAKMRGQVYAPNPEVRYMLPTLNPTP